MHSSLIPLPIVLLLISMGCHRVDDDVKFELDLFREVEGRTYIEVLVDSNFLAFDASQEVAGKFRFSNEDDQDIPFVSLLVEVKIPSDVPEDYVSNYLDGVEQYFFPAFTSPAYLSRMVRRFVK